MQTLHLPWICVLILILQTAVVSQTVKGHGFGAVHKPLRLGFAIMQNYFEICMSIRCESWQWKYKTCEAPANLKKDISRMNLEVKHSRSSCHFGESFGYIGRTVWVDHGCRATFKICYDKIIES